MASLANIFFCSSDKHPAEWRFFRSPHSKVIATQDQFESAFQMSTPETLWVSFHIDELSRYAARMASHLKWFRPSSKRPRQPRLLSLQRIRDSQSILVRSLFSPVVEAESKSFLPKEQLMDVLAADNSLDLAIGGSVDSKLEVLALVRGDLSAIVVPVSTFKETAAGVKADLEDFEIIDHGQTVRLGKYEAAVDALLYEFDSDYRRRHKLRLQAADKSFGGSLRRLRLQKGLSQTDFPGITEKEIGRIERGEVKQPQEKTIARLAKILAVAPHEIETF